MMKQELGRGVPLTIFGKDTKSSKSGKSKISAAKIVQTKIAQQVTVEANEKVAQILETGKLIEENLAPFAKLYGYDNAGQFIVNLVFPFFDSHYKHVRELDEENRNLRSRMQSLMNILNPEARRRLCQAQVFEMMQYWTVMGQLNNHPIPPLETLIGYVEVFWKVFCKDDEDTLKDHAYWTKRFIDKATQGRA